MTSFGVSSKGVSREIIRLIDRCERAGGRSLTLTDCQIDASNLREVLDLIRDKLPFLHSLDLQDNDIGDNLEPFIDFFRFVDLRQLLLGSNGITNFAPLVAALEHNRSLVVLGVSSNNLVDFKILVDLFKSETSIREIDFEGNPIRDYSALKDAMECQFISSLCRWDLDYAFRGPHESRELFISFCNMLQMNRLNWHSRNDSLFGQILQTQII